MNKKDLEQSIQDMADGNIGRQWILNSDTGTRIEVPSEFQDVKKILEMGAEKHGANSWLEPGVFTFEKRTSSQFRHLLKKTGIWQKIQHRTWTDLRRNHDLANAIELILDELQNSHYEEKNRLDDESGQPHELHEACNALMFYCLIERGIIKEEP